MEEAPHTCHGLERSAKRWRGCYRGRTAGDVQRSSTMTACEALAEHPKGGMAVAPVRNEPGKCHDGLACVLDGDGRLTADL